MITWLYLTNKKSVPAAIAVLALTILIPVGVRAQINGAKLSGTTTDASGTVIPNAKLSAKNLDTGEVTELTTNKQGFYQSPVLPPGNYEITVSTPGFAPQERTRVVLTEGIDQ